MNHSASSRRSTIAAFFAACCVSAPASALAASNWYVTPSGTGNGTSWTNAASFAGVQSQNIAPGDTVWLAGGNYPESRWIKGGAAGASVTLKRVRASDVTATSASGWQAGFDSLVSISQSLTVDASHVEVDGRLEYGIKVTTTDAGSATNPIAYREIALVVLGDDVKLAYVEAAGPYAGGAYINALSDSVGWYARSKTYGTGTPINQAVLSHSSIHGFVNLLYPYRAIGFVVEHTQLYDNGWANTSCATCVHPNVFADYFSQGTFRFNTVRHWQSEGIMMLGGESNWKIYGNLWFNDSPESSWGIQSQDSSGIQNVLVYNNTFVGLALPVVSVANGGKWGSGCAGANNIYWNASPSNGGGWPGDTASLVGSSGASPFVSLSGHDFRLSAGHGGTALPAPFNEDRYGNVRGGDGTFDVGAFEYCQSGNCVTAPAPRDAGAPGSPDASADAGSGMDGSADAGVVRLDGGCCDGSVLDAGNAALDAGFPDACDCDDPAQPADEHVIKVGIGCSIASPAEHGGVYAWLVSIAAVLLARRRRRPRSL